MTLANEPACTIWRVRRSRKKDGEESFTRETGKEEYADDVHAAFELASELAEDVGGSIRGATFSPVLSAFILDFTVDETQYRLSFSEEKVKTCWP